MPRIVPRSSPCRVLGIVAALLIAAAIPAADAIDQRVQDLLARMSVEEKAGQIVHYWRDKDGEPDAIPLAAGFRPPVRGKISPREYAEFINGLQRQVMDGSPNHIPALLHDECLHGAIAYARATSFPQSIALAASFDPDLVAQVASAIAEEERSVGVRLVLAPVLNLSRDPRWGRTEETFGESPRLAADVGVAYVKPFRERGIATALKHFVANYGDGGSDSAAVFIEASELHNVWFKPFRAAVQQGGALAVMPCYNSLNGLPAHANPWLLTTVLRQGWGFDGIVVSDYNAWQIHGAHKLLPPGGPDPRLDDVLPCYRAGMDLPLHHSAGLMPRIAAAVQEGRFPVAVLDAAAGRMLRTKALLGVLDQPFADPDRAEKVMHCAEHQALAKRAAVAGLTLLRNDGTLLPLNPEKIRRLGVAGPHAAKVKLGGYSRGVLPTDVHPLAGLQRRFGSEKVVHLTGTPEEMAKAAAGCDVVIYCAGVKEGEAVDRARFDLPGADAPEVRDQQPEAAGTAIIDKKKQDPLGNQVAEIRALGATGIPVVLALVAGSPVGLAPVESSVRAVLTTWYGGEAAGTALAEVLAGDAEPGGRLPITWPRHGGQIPIYHDLYPSGRGGIHYGDLESSPRFPFGFGLGYTTWTLSNLTVEAATVKAGEPIRLSVQVANTGTRAGSQVVQVYVAQRVAARVLPLQRLEVFRRVDLAAGEQRTITLELGPDHLGWYDADGVRHLDPGAVELRVGTSAGDLPLTASVTVGLADAGARKEEGGAP
jgi:beta-glucosidase